MKKQSFSSRLFYFFISLFRIIKFGFRNFSRNKGIAVGSVFILTITLFLLTGLIFFYAITDYLISQVRGKIDITAYFKENTPVEEIMSARDELLKIFPQIKSIAYISKEEALILFQKKHQGNEVLQKALEEVGENPFLPSLNIITSGDPLEYQEISEMLEKSSLAKYIERVDYSQKKDVINKIYSLTSHIKTGGVLISVVLLGISLLVILNTIKLAIDSSREEIKTMKIIGASNWFIRGPFIVQGIIYGVLSFLISLFFSSFLIYLTSSRIKFILAGFDINKYFLTNWWIFILIQLGFGIGIGILSGLISINRYLK